MNTGNRPNEPRCPLGNIQPVAMDTEEIKRAAWHDQGILVVSIRDVRLSWN